MLYLLKKAAGFANDCTKRTKKTKLMFNWKATMDSREGDYDDNDDESSSAATIVISNVNMSLFAPCCRQWVSKSYCMYLCRTISNLSKNAKTVFSGAKTKIGSGKRKKPAPPAFLTIIIFFSHYWTRINTTIRARCRRPTSPVLSQWPS